MRLLVSEQALDMPVLSVTLHHRPSTIDYDGRSALLEVATMGNTCWRTVASVSSR